jgi:hypothetical protein
MSRLRRQVRAAVAVMTGLGLPVALPAASASAADPLPTAVTAGGMPTPQVDGVVFSVAIVGNTVYAGGRLSKARPAGPRQVVPARFNRHNLLAFDLTSRALLPWAPDGGGAERGQGAGGRRGGAVTRPVRRARPSLRPARPDLDRGRRHAARRPDGCTRVLELGDRVYRWAVPAGQYHEATLDHFRSSLKADASMRSAYDLVLVDCASPAIAPGVTPIIRDSDGVIVVVRRDRETRAVQKLREQIGLLGGTITGYLFTFAQPQRDAPTRAVIPGVS